MRKARIVRVAAAVLAVLILMLLPCGAFAASGYTYTDRTVYFQRYSGGSWVDYVQKEYRLGGPDGPIIYCLEGGKYFSDGDLAEYIGQDAMVNILNADNAAGRLQDGLSVERYVKGLMIIACWGYPNYIPDGMSEDQARYATSAAMHAYTGVSVKSPLTQGFGYSFLGETDPVNRMRAKPGVSGSDAVYDWYSQLYNLAILGIELPQSVSVTPQSAELAWDGSNFAGEFTVKLKNMNRGYSIDAECLAGIEAAGGSISGYTGNDGDVLRVSVPGAGNHDKSFTLSVTAEDTRNYANLGIVASSTEPSRWQKCVGFLGNSGNMKKNASAVLTTGNFSVPVAVQKVSSDPQISASALYSLDGAEFLISGVGLDGAEVSETLVTDAQGRAAGQKLYAAGSEVTVKELKAPLGFKLAEEQRFTVGGEDTVFTVTDDPKAAPVGLVLRKEDSQSGAAQGNAALHGARYSFAFYAGLFDSAEAAEASGSPARSWEFETDSEGRIFMDEAHKKGGDDLYTMGGQVVLPYGTLVIKEAVAPEGYLLDESTHLIRVEPTEDGGAPEAVSAIVSKEAVKRFGISGRKLDAAKEAAEPSGDAVLSGAVISVYNVSRSAVTVDGTAYEPGQKVAEMVTAADGSYSLGAVLPYGSYELKETAAPAGYALSDWSCTLVAREDDADGTVLQVPEDQALKDKALAQTLIIRKKDAAEQGFGVPEGYPAEALEGIRFEVVNSSAASVVCGGREVAPGEVAATAVTAFDEASGEYRAVVRGLPYGSYSVRELSGDGLPSGMANEWYFADSMEAVSAVLHAGAGEGPAALDFADSRACSLSISKIVSGNMGNREKVFDFELALGDNRGVEVCYEKQLADGSTQSGSFDPAGGSFAFQLKHGEKMQLSRIVYGSSYKLTENGAAEDGYTVSCDGPLEGSVQGNMGLIVENTRNAVVTTGVDTGLMAGGASAALGITVLAAGTVLRRRRSRYEG